MLLEFSGRHFLVLGSMKELGENTIKYHLEIIQFIERSNLDGFVFLCDKNLEIGLKKEYLFRKKIYFVNDINQISKLINIWLKKGDNLLIKGSRYWHLENLIPLID